MKIQSLIFVYTIQIFIINSLHLLTKKFKNDIIKYIKIVKGVREKMSDKCLTVNELFSGIGTQAFALEYMKIPHKVVGTAEIEKNAIEAYNIAHGETRNYGDISKIESLDYADLWTYSFPCFTGAMKVLTNNGYKKIKDIKPGMFVYTHTGKLQKVINFFDNGKHPIINLKLSDTDIIETTSNHKFLVNRSKNIEWIMCKDLQIGDKVCKLSDKENKYNYVIVENISPKNTIENVYDIEVETDHSFIINGVITHNCQDLSSGGKCIGIAEKGMNAQDEHGNKIATRSGLLWEVERLLAHSCGYDIDKKTNKLIKNEEYEVNPPKYLLLENVAELVKVRRHNDHFRNWRDRLTELGYITSIAILNGKDFGIPQNRERVFCLSVRKDVYPDEVYLPSTAKVHPAKFEDFVDKEVLNYKGGLMIDPAISDYLMPAYTRDLEAISKSDKEIFTCECKSGFQDHRVGITAAPTIRHQNQHTAIFVNNQIHKLTACECWKFMGIKEEDFWKVKNNSNISNNIMCGLAGNAIVVPVLMSIFYQIYLIETRGYPIENPATVPYLTLKDNVENLNPALFD